MSKAWPTRNLNPDDPVGDVARRILRVRMGEYYSYAPIVDDPGNRQALHDMRISAKRLRYTLELFHSVFGEVGSRNITRVKAIQEELGNLHDIDVRVELIEDELTKLSRERITQLSDQLRIAPPESHASIVTRELRPPPDDPRRGLTALLGRQHAEGQAHYSAFLQLWDQYESEGMRAELARLSATSG